MTLSTTDTGTTADDSGNSEPGPTEIEMPAEGTLGTYLEVFTDEGLRTAVMAKAGAQDEDEILTQETAESITYLDASRKDITNLEGLQYFTELTELWLSNNDIQTITALSGLTSLTKLIMPTNKIMDLSPLSNLKKLDTLNLFKNQIVDIGPLSELKNLTYLNLTENQVTDIGPLQGLTNLTNLHLGQNQIADIAPLARATKLKYLDLQGNRIVDVSPLRANTALTTVYLHTNQIADITPLAGLTTTEIYADHQSITHPGTTIAKGSTLAIPLPKSFEDISANDFSPTEPTAIGTSAEWHDIADSGTYSFAFESDLLDRGSYGGTVQQEVTVVGLGTIEALFPDKALAKAIAGYVGKDVTDPFLEEDVEELTVFGVLEEGVSNLEGMQLLTNLGTLTLAGNNITDITLLSGLGKLEYLDLEANNISDISVLSNLNGLEKLYLDSNHIADLSPLSGLSSLEAVSAMNQTITRPAHTLPSGATHTMESARGIDGELVEATVVEPTHGTASNGVATWGNVTLAGNHVVSFDSSGEMVQGFTANRAATRAPEVAYSGTITQAVKILTTPAPEDPDPTTPEEGNGSGTGTGSGSSNANGTTGGMMSATSLPAALSRTGTDTTGLIIITLLCTLVGAGALLMLRKGRRHLHRIPTSL